MCAEVKNRTKKSGYIGVSTPKMAEPLTRKRRQEIEREIVELRIQLSECENVKQHLSLKGKIGALTLTLKGGNSRSKGGIAGMAARWHGGVKKK